MARRVGICAVAQTTVEHDKWYERFQGMALEVLEKLREQVAVEFSRHTGKAGIDMSINVSDDVFDARTISDNGMTDVLGAHFGCEEKVAQEGIQAIYYGLAAIQSGHCDQVLIIGHCKESQPKSRNMVSHMAFDQKTGITDEQLAKVVVRARENAAKNPYTPEIEPVSAETVMQSEMLADPIRELHAYPVSDGAVGMVLAAEDIAKKMTDRPVWITGVGNCMDSFFFGDRDLASNFALRKAAEWAYKRAGINDPRGAFDLVEISDQYAYQHPMWMEGLGLCEEGKGGDWIDNEGPAKGRVNPSGGMLAGSPLILGGLFRAAEAALQLREDAGNHQIDDVKKALAHGVMGPAGQFHSVVTLERG